jgi:DNA-directed RNA polymerase subunit RPC12/RpoP
MRLFCGTDGDYDGGDWWWYPPADEKPLATKRSRKCCSCGKKVGVGETARKIARCRPPTEFEETRGIACDEVPMSDWYLCETCGDLADSLAELGFCYQLGNGESLKQQIVDYRAENAK